MTAPRLLELRGLTYRPRRRKASGDVAPAFGLGPIDWSLEEPALVAVLGRNGSGKSTLLKRVAGVLDPEPGEAGELRLGGEDPRRWSEAQRARGTTFIAPDLHTEFPVSVEDAIRLGGWHAGAGGEDRALAAAADWAGVGGLLAREVRSLSGGERQRVNLARAHAQGARLWLLDEALSALDLPHQAEFARKLARLPTERGIGVLWVSHDLNFALAHATRALWLADGKVVAAGSVAETLNSATLEAAFPGVVLHAAGSARSRGELGLP